MAFAAFAITCEEAWWFLHSWDLCPFNGPPEHVIHLAVTLLSASASAAGQAVQTSSVDYLTTDTNV